MPEVNSDLQLILNRCQKACGKDIDGDTTYRLHYKVAQGLITEAFELGNSMEKPKEDDLNSVLYYNFELILTENKFPNINGAASPITSIWLSDNDDYTHLLTCSETLHQLHDSSTFFMSEIEMLKFFKSKSNEYTRLATYNADFDEAYMINRGTRLGIEDITNNIPVINVVNLVKILTPEIENITLKYLCGSNYTNFDAIEFMKKIILEYTSHCYQKLRTKLIENSCYGIYNNEDFTFYNPDENK